MTRPFRRWLTLPLSVRWAVVLWAALLVGVTARVAVSRPLSQTVVPIYLKAGHRWLASQDLYEPIPGMDLYRNPPGVAALFAPFTLVMRGYAIGIVWRLGSAAVFLVGLHRFRRAVAPDLSPDRVGWMFALSAVLALPSVNNGQMNILVAGACLGGAAAVAERRWWAAAGWFGLGFGLKIYPLAVGMLAALAAPRQLAPRLAAVCAGVALVPFLLQDPGYVLDQHRSFERLLGLDDRTYSDWQRVTRDWSILPRVYLGLVPPAAASKAVGVLAGAVMAGFVLAAARAGMGLGLLAGLGLSLGSVWMTLFGPATESATYSLLAGVGAWQAVRPNRSRWAGPLARVGCGLLAAAVLRAAFPADWQFTALGPQPIAAVLLLASEVASVFATSEIVRTTRRQTKISGPSTTRQAMYVATIIPNGIHARRKGRRVHVVLPP